VNEQHVPIAGFVEALRDELTYAVASAQDRPFQFGLGTVEIELSIEATFHSGEVPGIRLWVVSGVPASTLVQKLHLSLTPVRTDSDHEVSDSGEDDGKTGHRAPDVVTVQRESLSPEFQRRYADHYR
jgi:hypothetical protein